jgi:DNA-binding NarL/FixJ family response regulator
MDFAGHAEITTNVETRLSEALTERELHHAKLVAEGFSNREVARLSGCSPKYMANKMSLIYRKLGIGKSEGSSSHDPRIILTRWYEREFGSM